MKSNFVPDTGWLVRTETGDFVRVIAGAWKGMQLTAPTGDVARPTTDRVKESMFNLMGIAWSGGIAVDLFGGSGALALEAVSRGADSGIVVDKHPRSLRAIRENVQKCHAESLVGIWKMDWAAAWRRVEAEHLDVGWVFVDPPYKMALWESVLATVGAGNVRILHGVVCEHPKSCVLPESTGCLRQWKTKGYGDIHITIYRADADLV